MRLSDEAATVELGSRLARHALDGDVIALTGDLGMGKSVLARAIARGLGVKGRIPSPTFVLLHSYEEGRLPFHHIDVYRLGSADEIEQLGLDEVLVDGVTVIEWAERFPELLPPDHLALTLDEDGCGRRVTATPCGPRSTRWWDSVS